MADLGKEILAAVQKAFTNKTKTDIVVTDLQKRLRESGVSYREAEEYAARIGELLSKALQENISPEILPGGKMSLDLAEEILRPLLTQNYEEASRVAAEVQKSLNERAGLGMNALRPEVNEDRATGIIEKISSYDSYEEGSWLTGEPVVNYTQSAVEDTIRKNADAHFKAGLLPKIKRIATGGCCKWCRSLAGTYDYPVDREVYRRHENCRCLVLYDPRDGGKIQDAHTKAQYEGSLEQAEKSARDARIKKAVNISNQADEQFHRRIGKRGREIVDQPTYNRLTSEYLRRGGTIYRDEASEKHLDVSGNGASYVMGANTTFFRRDATVSEVLEEMYHAWQDRVGLFNEFPEDEILLRREINAQKYVMGLKKRYKIPALEMEELQRNLEDYERALEELMRSKT